MSSEELAASQGPTTVEKLRGLPWGIAWSVTNSVFAKYTFFGSIFVLFLNQVGLDKSQIGSLLALLPFFGIIAVFIAAPVARAGQKRVFIISFTARTALALLLLLVPMFQVRFGPEATLALIIVAVGAFGLARAVGFTAYYPWSQEQVPSSVRGKYTAIRSTLANLTGMLAVLAAGWILGPDPDLGPFMVLISIGVVCGGISVWASSKIPGGAPIKDAASEEGSTRGMLAAARDRSFVRYLLVVGLVTLSTVPLISFVPLFMIEEVGLSSDQVVWLEMAVLVGAVASGYLWGWLADRYGSKPVMQSGVYLLPLAPLAWLLMPRGVALSLYLAVGIAVAQGLINTGWTLGSARLLFVGIVPAEKRSAYMALYYAWAGIAGGVGSVLGGWLVDLTADVSGQWWIVHFDSYTLLFLMGITFPLFSILLFRGVTADSSVTTGQFASMFVRGNPFYALGSLVRYRRARDERAAIEGTERLGSTRSPLTVEELIEALHDPRFGVRFEAVVAMARHGEDPQLTDALIEVLEGNEPSLSTMAAWALGRLEDERALEVLRRGMDARYRSVQAHCIRSLGSLGDRTMLPVMLERLETEQDVGVQLALASALGKLGATGAIDRLLALLHESDTQDERGEFALAIARLVGQEHHFIQLQRSAQTEPGTVFSQETTALKERLPKADQATPELAGDVADSLDTAASLDAAAEVLAREDLVRGVELLAGALRLMAGEDLALPCHAVVRECTAQMEQLGPERIEYVVLALHAAECGLPEDGGLF